MSSMPHRHSISAKRTAEHQRGSAETGHCCRHHAPTHRPLLLLSCLGTAVLSQHLPSSSSRRRDPSRGSQIYQKGAKKIHDDATRAPRTLEVLLVRNLCHRSFIKTIIGRGGTPMQNTLLGVMIAICGNSLIGENECV